MACTCEVAVLFVQNTATDAMYGRCSYIKMLRTAFRLIRSKTHWHEMHGADWNKVTSNSLLLSCC